MPEKRTLKRAKQKKRQGKSPSTQAGEFVREEMHHIRKGKHGARSTKQAIAIGLSKARKAGINVKKKSKGKGTHKKKRNSTKKSSGKKSKSRAKATLSALKREPQEAASFENISEQVRRSARERGPADRKRAARKAARNRTTHEYVNA